MNHRTAARRLSLLAALLTATAIITTARAKRDQLHDNSTIDSLNIERYMGRWYEIARFDHPFERNMSNVTATYSLNKNGTINVLNQGYDTRKNRHKSAHGRARAMKDGTAGQLEVAFFANFWSPYYILELAPDYRYALVGSRSDKYLWILSRTPELSRQDTRYLLRRAAERGYDISKLIVVKQD